MSVANKIYQKRIDKVIEYLQQHLDENIPLKKLAEIAHFSPYHFHRIFVAIKGESVHFCTNRMRLEKAARLLKYSEKKIAHIAEECGFSSPSTFSRAFKAYFSTSPRVYQKTGLIENSKICKELFPMDKYLVPMTIDQLERKFPVSIQTFAERRIAYIRVSDSFREGVVLEAFSELKTWAESNGLLKHQEIFGMSLDDPLTTPQAQYMYEVCLTLPKEFTITDDMQSMTLPSCKYATTRVSGDLSMVGTATHYLWNTWLIKSHYEPAHQHGLEIYLDKENMLDWSHFELDLCIPIKNLNDY